ncbi:hypothetical protein FVEG_17677 [Fusarium verticillioides 7600]|uniref:Uncharacterized protein n=1 Tax=Gibberella moniliformis (strain M3125 / FGSC 7600) TaxID=334819 RepID=A0A139YBM4_GIBM7|nr:hypothetical protein FVEG_17677 [Fusarium verticillioides 7600]KYG13699.1 hypothetical protein FVEG_17677 [Fusarium verticillioides 7600]
MLLAELLGVICELIKVEEFMALALCSQRLWSHATMWIKSSYTRWKNKYSWVNTPIIYTAAGLRVLPKALQHILPEPTSKDTERESERTGRRYEIGTARASIWFKESADSYEKVPFPYDCLYEEVFLKQFEAAYIPERLHSTMKASLPRFNLEPGGSWLLRNLNRSRVHKNGSCSNLRWRGYYFVTRTSMAHSRYSPPMAHQLESRLQKEEKEGLVLGAARNLHRSH